MAWLARLDARAARLPRPLHWSYLALKWYLVILGLVISVGLCRQELSEKRVGLGSGICVTLLFAGIKGVVDALFPMSTESPDPTRPPSDG